MIYAFCRTLERIWQNPLNSPFTDNTLLSIILEQLLFDESKKNSWKIKRRHSIFLFRRSIFVSHRVDTSKMVTFLQRTHADKHDKFSWFQQNYFRDIQLKCVRTDTLHSGFRILRVIIYRWPKLRNRDLKLPCHRLTLQ